MPQGIVLVGTVPKSGKTVACAGIAACLKENGFPVQVSKPIAYGGVGIQAPEFNSDQRFINAMVKPLSPPEALLLPTRDDLTPVLWKRMLEQLRAAPYPQLLESVGTIGTPLRYPTETPYGSTHSIIDAIDFARLLKFGLIVVTPKSSDLYGQLAPTLAYLASRHERALGWIAVGTSLASENVPDWEMQSLMISRDYETPQLGEIAYSTSISVEACQTGNLLNQTEYGIDLLPLQQSLELAVC